MGRPAHVRPTQRDLAMAARRVRLGDRVDDVAEDLGLTSTEIQTYMGAEADRERVRAEEDAEREAYRKKPAIALASTPPPYPDLREEVARLKQLCINQRETIAQLEGDLKSARAAAKERPSYTTHKARRGSAGPVCPTEYVWKHQLRHRWDDVTCKRCLAKRPTR